MLLNALPLLAPLVLLAAAFAPRLISGIDARRGAGLAEGASLAAVAVAVLSAVVLAVNGSGDSVLFGMLGIGLSVRLDIVSIVMLLLVSFIGWVVVRYSRTYLDGEPRHDEFTFWLLVTLATVLTLVQSGNVVQFVGAWVATSMFLHKLLVFYPERMAAQRAARKKYVMARVGDISLVAAAALLTVNYGTTQISGILASAGDGIGGPMALCAGALIALAAILKSAQFPTRTMRQRNMLR